MSASGWREPDASTAQHDRTNGAIGANGANEKVPEGPGPRRPRLDRDELRRRILAEWADGAGPDDPTTVAGRGPPASMPSTDAGGVDPSYIRGVMRDEFFPMAAGCYEELRSRYPDAGGTVTMSFSVVRDPELGGLVEDVTVDGADAGTPLGDVPLQTCLRESMSSVGFAAPPGEAITIAYPVTFEP